MSQNETSPPDAPRSGGCDRLTIILLCLAALFILGIILYFYIVLGVDVHFVSLGCNHQLQNAIALRVKYAS